MKLAPYLTPCTSKKMNSWIKGFNVKGKLVTFLESKIGKYLYDFLVEENFLNKTPKSICSPKGNI